MCASQNDQFYQNFDLTDFYPKYPFHNDALISVKSQLVLHAYRGSRPGEGGEGGGVLGGVGAHSNDSECGMWYLKSAQFMYYFEMVDNKTLVENYVYDFFKKIMFPVL